MAPHFFHIILKKEPRLRLAKKFVKIHGDNLPSLVSLEVPTGLLWEVELTRTNGEVWLDKGFQEFKEHCSIGSGYLLVFRYDGDTRFHVLVFDRSTTEVEYPYAVPKQECEENMPDDSSPSREDRQVHSKGFVSCKGKFANPRDKEVPMKVSADQLKRGHTKRQKVGDDVLRKGSDKTRDTKTEKVSINEGRKSARFKDTVSEAKKASTVKFALPDHQSKSIRDKRLKLKIEKPYAKTECNASTGRHRQIPVRGRKAIERSIAYQRAKACNWKNPFFISVMRPTHVEDSCVLCIPKKFAKEHISSQESCNLVLRFPDGKAWTVTLRIHSDAKFGWREIVEDNDLKVGDVCVFERGNGSKGPLFNVIIFRKTEDAEGSSCRNVNRDKEECNASTGHHRKLSVRGRTEKERSIAYRRAKACNWRNSFFISVMRPTYVEDKCVLSIPKKFATEHISSQESCNLVLRFPDGKAWTVTLRIHSDARCSWREIVEHNDLKVGDVCVFECGNGSKDPLFNVIIFRKTEDAEGSSRRNVNRDKEDRSNILDDYSSGKNKKRKGEEIPDGASIEILEAECNASTGHHQQLSVRGRKAKERFIAYRRAKACNWKNPFFISFMRPTYVEDSCALCIPKKFAKEHISSQESCNLELRFPDGKTWTVTLRIHSDAKFGWREIVGHYDLTVGDVCVFERGNGCKHPLFNVIIFRKTEDAEGSSLRNVNRDKEDRFNILDDYSSGKKKKRKGEEVADGASIEIL